MNSSSNINTRSKCNKSTHSKFTITATITAITKSLPSKSATSKSIATIRRT